MKPVVSERSGSSGIVALHGFLGLPSDWDFLRDEFDVRAIDVLREPIPDTGELLLGYSLGGRLALQALLGGARYQRAVIVSTRVSDAEGDRRERDEAWARRFESDDWELLLRDWNAQSLFGGHAMPRDERAFDRPALARALRDLSPAVLPPVSERLQQIGIPVLWIAGERDTKYVAEGRRAVELLPRAELAIVPGAAHRVPWEQPVAFRALLRGFVSRAA
jgi:2-succinyl-6-hydroxy-2,4-cyclohexadiene-1-carboxylate synthase